MDDILEACFEKDLFKPPLHHSKQTNKTMLESRHPYAYANKLEPIYKAHKVPKEEVAALECQATCEIAQRDNSVSENDLFFHYFAQLSSQDKEFM